MRLKPLACECWRAASETSGSCGTEWVLMVVVPSLEVVPPPKYPRPALSESMILGGRVSPSELPMMRTSNGMTSSSKGERSAKSTNAADGLKRLKNCPGRSASASDLTSYP